MDIQIKGKNLEVQPTVRDYVVRKLDKISRHLPKILAFDVEISQEGTRSPQQQYVVQVTIDNNGTLLRGEERGQDIFTAIDKVAEIMSRQVEHYRGKLQERGRGGSVIRGTASEPAKEPATPATAMPKIVKQKRFNIKPMSLEEAIDQMDLLGHDFFLFRNSETEDINLVYRRKDGNLGLIETTRR